MTSKRCAGCKREFPLEVFGLDNGRKHGRQSWCPGCKRLSAQLTQYNLRREDAEMYMALVDHLCAICNRPVAMNEAVVDHSHHDLEVRGLLHDLCNRRPPDTVFEAKQWLAYLEAPPMRQVFSGFPHYAVPPLGHQQLPMTFSTLEEGT